MKTLLSPPWVTWADVLNEQHNVYHCTEPLAIQLPSWP